MRRVFISSWMAFAVFLCLAFSARAQNINISYVTNKEPNTSASIQYGDVWGDGNILCLGVYLGYTTPYGVGIYTNLTSPTLVSTYNTTGSENQFEQGIVRSNIGYFASWSGGGLHIVSLTNPAAPVLLSKINVASNGFARVHTMFLERNFLYEAAHQNTTNWIKVFNVSNPFAPVFLRNITNAGAYKIHQITTVKKGAQTILYTSDFGNGGSSPGQTDIWDVTDIGTQAPLFLGKITSGASSHSSWPTPDGNTLVVCRETTGGEVKLYDISNPAAPVLQSVISPATLGMPAALPHNPVVISNLLYLSWYQHGLQIFDITDRTKPVRIGSYDTFPGSIASSFQGNWGVFPDLGLNKILLSDMQTGLYILDASAVLTATNNYPPLLVTQPVSITTTQGLTASLSSTATGSSVKYQWRFNNAILGGATNSALVFNSVQSSNSGNYFVVATNSLGSVTSSVATLTVNLPSGSAPTITGEPQDAAVYAGNDATFTVAVTGFAPLSYQWRFNGVDIPGATTNSLPRPNVQPEQVGNYSVVVTNEYGSATSSNALLSIIDSPYLNTIQAAPGGRSALISWNSTIPSDSQVQFDVANGIIAAPDGGAAQGASFGNSSYIDRTLTTNHTMLLTGLNPGTRYSFQVISSADTNSFLSGVYQFTTAGTNIIDNPAATYIGTWQTSTNSLDKYGADYSFASSVVGSPTATATFRPNLTTPGKYDVAVWYPEGGNRANNAPYAISYNGGSNNVSVNQQINGGQFNLIGANLSFASGTAGFVRLANNANASVVLADAVQFTYVDAQETPADNSVPTWWANFYGVTDPLADPDGDDYSTAEEYLLGTSPTNDNSHLDLEVQASGGSANITFWPYIGNRTYQLLFKTNLADATWQTLSPGAITPTPYGHGIFSLSTGSVSNGFYRLAVQPVALGDFSGKIPVPRGDAYTGFAEAACGVNRVFVKPRR